MKKILFIFSVFLLSPTNLFAEDLDICRYAIGIEDIARQTYPCTLDGIVMYNTGDAVDFIEQKFGYGRCGASMSTNPEGQTYPCFYAPEVRYFRSATQVRDFFGGATDPKTTVTCSLEDLMERPDSLVYPCYNSDYGRTINSAQEARDFFGGGGPGDPPTRPADCDIEVMTATPARQVYPCYDNSYYFRVIADEQDAITTFNISDDPTRPFVPPDVPPPGPVTGGSCAGPKDLRYIMCVLSVGVITPITKIIAALAFVYFLWGTGKYLRTPGDNKSREAAKDMMIWGLVALFVMVSVWGLVQIIMATFLLENSAPPRPTVPSVSMADH